ncbi:MAG: branched-chain amino acid ABC transporter permease [Candidatus Hodarchaeales archaeon]|jgi:branched-chain amino acid transport system permease protein
MTLKTKSFDWRELAEGFWDEVKDKAYYILGIALIIFIPFLMEAPGFPPIPILSDIYAIGREIRLFGANNYMLDILILCMLWGIFAASWDLLSGYTGQISFGHAIFFGFAPYVAFWFSVGIEVDPLLIFIFGTELIFDPMISVILGGVFAALIAVIIGIIALRVKGPYLALVTLIIPLIARSLFRRSKTQGFNLYDLTGGDHGFFNIPQVLEGWDYIDFYLLMVLVLFITVGLMMFIAYSRFGLAFKSIREDEDAAESLGINLKFYKILAFAISALFAGIAGGLYAQYRNVVQPKQFESFFSFNIILMCVVGGIGSISGGVVGAFLLTLFVRLLLGDIFPTEGIDFVAFGLLLVLTLRYMPFGLTRATKEQKKGVIFGLLFALSWVILPYSNILNLLSSLTLDNIILSLTLILLFILTLPAIPIFIVSEFLGLFLLEGLMGFTFSAKALIKAKFLIYTIVGIPFAFYLPKIFKRIRLKFWGVWPSVGRYEPD